MGSYSWEKRPGELDLSAAIVNETVLSVLLEEGATGWRSKHSICQSAAKQLGGEQYGFGDKFDGQVGRALNKLAEDPRFVKIGKGEHFPTIEGDTRSGYGGEPQWATVEYQAKCQAAVEKSEAARKAVEERCSQIVKKTTAAGYFADTHVFAERSGYGNPPVDPAGRWTARVTFPLSDVEAITDGWSTGVG